MQYQIEIRYETKISNWKECLIYFGHLEMFDLLFITNEWQLVNVKLKCQTFKKIKSIIGGGEKILSPPTFYIWGRCPPSPSRFIRLWYLYSNPGAFLKKCFINTTYIMRSLPCPYFQSHNCVIISICVMFNLNSSHSICLWWTALST